MTKRTARSLARGIYSRSGLHVSASGRGVIRYAMSRLRKDHRFAPKLKQERRLIYRAMLAEHADAQGLYRYVNHGEIRG